GIHDNLFDLGGNSLLVFQIAARAAQSGYAIPPRLLFEHPTIAELAAAAGTLPATSVGMTEISA
ncbi:MAG TPA: phosphopantetheine-binding protein, partial [Thermoanaerobaculia bacterium]|nr:phosphopantetheine-binding protein [Thermoanaerobaculia bacterium]